MASSYPGSPSRLGYEAADRLILFGVSAAGLVSALLLLWALGDIVFAAAFLATFLALAMLVLLFAQFRRASAAAAPMLDIALLGAALDEGADAVAITDRAGKLVYANRTFANWFRGYAPPPGIPLGEQAVESLSTAARAAWRDGQAPVHGIRLDHGPLEVSVARAGQHEDHLVWRFGRAETFDIAGEAARMIEGEPGLRLGEAGMMAVLVAHDGRVIAANRVFGHRALGGEGDIAGRSFVDLLHNGEDGRIRLAQEDEDAAPLRLVQVPIDPSRPDGPTLFVILDEADAASGEAQGPSATNLYALLGMMPLGLALAERDGRFLFINDAFARAAGTGTRDTPVYPSDLVVKEDKSAVSDAVRRFAAGQAMSGDIAIRLKHRPEEPVALTIAGARGLGSAAVLLSLKDNSEENRLKRQVAQATKMQAVGQLAGGVAHDFNNILTAIIGHCDLMMMRHTPGDSDYDDIQQIKHNSNRAAGLTRQLLAFSRQQTLRPQILQLPDVISEISNLLKRLLGETVTLVVKHGRNLGAVRADPGQLEQVIVNLAVNARDAMADGGTLTLQTYSVSSTEVRQLGSDILPIADYTALSVSDTGVGIPADVLGKVFEPFFTTKEVGKGTGLGLSTVYGIVKQSGGFIFVDSKVGQGTTFVIYLPVHRAETPAPTAPLRKEKSGELWGSGTILLVEDEDMVRAVAERALSRQGYKVLTASNGEEALETLEAAADNEPIDLLISDVVMPTMDGPTLVRHAREKFPALPILFMSGYAEEQLRRSIAIDNVAFLPKPFSVQQLAEAARDTLRPAQPREDAEEDETEE
ncbi:hybrid sensor histidine kinase/response regulator [Flavisphingomonas formosensis]|uniref:hybrid sensor histidine kinase/response regulator n=1 Tax=Flavisphingomonas formosensis TaxID=861534 RepID=UPI0012F85B1B|nr:ATP-binding protein [Sphingomonas formosensis]